MNKKVLWLLSVLMIALFVLSACGGAKGVSAVEAPAEEEPAEEVVAEEPAEEVAAEEPAEEEIPEECIPDEGGEETTCQNLQRALNAQKANVMIRLRFSDVLHASTPVDSKGKFEADDLVIPKARKALNDGSTMYILTKEGATCEVESSLILSESWLVEGIQEFVLGPTGEDFYDLKVACEDFE